MATRFLALDWDQNQVHIIEANIRGTSVQVRKAVVLTESRVPNPADAETLGHFLRDRLKEAGISPAPVLACVARDRVIVKEVRYPQVPDNEEPAIVRFQAIKELTDAADDVIIDYATSGNNGNGERKAHALVIRREVLTTYQKLCQAAGLKLHALTPRMVGVAACLRQVIGKTIVTPPPEPADGVIGVVVIGEKTAELCVLRESVFLLARSMPSAANLAGDIRRNLAVHAGQMPQHPIVAVYLAGKGAGELRERLSEMVEVPVHTFDPFAGSEARGLPAGNRGTFAAALGLLQSQATGLPINFVSPRQPTPPKNPNVRIYRLLIVAGVTLVLGLLCLGQLMAAMRNAEAERLESERNNVVKLLAATQEQTTKFKSVDDWDGPVWIDEFYELTSRIVDVNALRITSIDATTLSRTGTSKVAGKVTLKGRLLLKENPQKPLRDLEAAFRREGYYTPKPFKVENDTFTMEVNIERRPPTAFTAKVEEQKDVKAVESDAKGKDGKGAKGKGKGK